MPEGWRNDEKAFSRCGGTSSRRGRRVRGGPDERYGPADLGAGQAQLSRKDPGHFEVRGPGHSPGSTRRVVEELAADTGARREAPGLGELVGAPVQEDRAGRRLPERPAGSVQR